MEKLYVLTCISNPQRYVSRYKLYHEFERYMKQFPNVELYTVELSYKGRPFVVTQEGNEHHIQVRGEQEYWHKENLLEIGRRALPPSAKKIAWVDADVTFTNPNWVNETLHALDHYKFVQMFGEYSDLGPNFEVTSTTEGFVKAWKNNPDEMFVTDGNGAVYSARKGATGLAWAATQEALNAVGGFLDWCVVGSGDWHMAYCLIERGVEIAQPWFSTGYRMLLEKWESDCRQYIRKSVGYINSGAVHYWHGPKVNRGYGWRWNIIRENGYDPILDLKRDHQGLYIVNEQKGAMLNALRDYFESRKEDSMELK